MSFENINFKLSMLESLIKWINEKQEACTAILGSFIKWANENQGANTAIITVIGWIVVILFGLYSEKSKMKQDLRYKAYIRITNKSKILSEKYTQLISKLGSFPFSQMNFFFSTDNVFKSKETWIAYLNSLIDARQEFSNAASNYFSQYEIYGAALSEVLQANILLIEEYKQLLKSLKENYSSLQELKFEDYKTWNTEIILERAFLVGDKCSEFYFHIDDINKVLSEILLKGIFRHTTIKRTPLKSEHKVLTKKGFKTRFSYNLEDYEKFKISPPKNVLKFNRIKKILRKIGLI